MLVSLPLCRNICNPPSHTQTSDMFHGASRLFGAYIIQNQVQPAVVFFQRSFGKAGSFCQCLCYSNIGRLDAPDWCFDKWTSFPILRKQPPAVHSIPGRFNQRSLCHYMVEKHGQGPDSAVFTRIRIWFLSGAFVEGRQ